MSRWKRRHADVRVAAGLIDAAELDRRCQGLTDAAQAAAGRLRDEPVRDAERVLEHIAQRRRYSDDLTVVALAGPTGAGKSSLFNALVGQDVASVAATRPTTDHPTAALWTSSESAGPLLEWLGVGRWHLVEGAAPASEPAPSEPEPSELAGLVLLDLPDQDSIAATHRQQVDVLVNRVDIVIWVLDPQKYADALVHEAYLAQFAHHDEVTVVLLNQVDRLGPDDAQACREHLGELVAADGLPATPILGVSAHTGEGLDDVRELLVTAVRDRRAALRRLAADLALAAQGLREAAGDTGAVVQPMPADGADQLASALAEAAGVGMVATAVRDSVRRSGAGATGWPALRWVYRLRGDPATRLRLSRPHVDPALLRTSIPPASPVALAGATASARAYAERASAGAPPDWVRSTRAVAVTAAKSIGPHLDGAVAQAGLAAPRPPRWWSVVGGLQWLLLAAAAGGAAWLLGLVVLGALAIPTPDPAMFGGLPVPTVLLLGGTVLGMVLAALARSVTRVTADRAAARARTTITDNVARVAKERVADPVSGELNTLARFRGGIVAAAGE